MYFFGQFSAALYSTVFFLCFAQAMPQAEPTSEQSEVSSTVDPVQHGAASPTTTELSSTTNTAASSTTTAPPPTDTPQVFIMAERGLSLDQLSIDENWTGWLNANRWRVDGKGYRAFQMNDTYTQEVFQALMYPVEEAWTRTADPNEYFAWTTGTPTRTGRASISSNPPVSRCRESSHAM
ncbi:uncharacterized protein I303_106120 [Kwoniella dejecticola CBS 10117]|uniref:Uncharacterized protein n=1 Tax=Kwoniella dejecticola CBS 10117 TaxID=1296121 RepID=A0A1A6A1C0_9TREE|nr:uncharacterized protein I303_06139 [Kwoniella dejecticola CBS 10117]OBR83856.1 hypothetical protein I303_06139 [Kwoniella dejecticola CBS 10117]